MSVFDSLSQHQQELIRKHLELVIEANKTINLTRIDSLQDGMMLHVEDSLSGLEELNNAPEGLYGDLGSGAGYPGIPLAIATGRQSVLVDARKKKMQAVEKIIDELGLSGQISAYAGRAELLARTQSKRYAALTARALSQTAVLLELASPLLQPDGVLICYKSQVSDNELADAKKVQPLVGMKFEKDRSFMLGGEYQRRIMVFRKIGEPQIRLPRLEGEAQKKPLSERASRARRS